MKKTNPEKIPDGTCNRSTYRFEFFWLFYVFCPPQLFDYVNGIVHWNGDSTSWNRGFASIPICVWSAHTVDMFAPVLLSASLLGECLQVISADKVKAHTYCNSWIEYTVFPIH